MKVKTKKQIREFNALIDAKIEIYKEIANNMKVIESDIFNIQKNVRGLRVDLASTSIRSVNDSDEFIHPIFMMSPFPPRPGRFNKNEMTRLTFSQKYLIDEGMDTPLNNVSAKIFEMRDKILYNIIPELMRMKIDV